MSKHFNINNRECRYSGKIYYETELLAIQAIGAVGRRHEMLMRHYFCKHCKGFHLARIKKKKRENRHERIPD